MSITSLPILLDAIKEQEEKFVLLKKEWQAKVSVLMEDMDCSEHPAYVSHFSNNEKRKLDICMVTLAVFNAFYYEGLINFYGKINLDKDGVNMFESVDKLSTLNKWIVYPKLVQNVQLSNRDEWYCLMKQTFKVRNTYAHPKVIEYDGSDKCIDNIHKNSKIEDYVATKSETLRMKVLNEIKKLKYLAENSKDEVCLDSIIMMANSMENSISPE